MGTLVLQHRVCMRRMDQQRRWKGCPRGRRRARKHVLWRPVSSQRQSEARAVQGHCSRQDKLWTGRLGPGSHPAGCSDRRPVLLGASSPSKGRDTVLAYSFRSGQSWRTPQWPSDPGNITSMKWTSRAGPAGRF